MNWVGGHIVRPPNSETADEKKVPNWANPSPLHFGGQGLKRRYGHEIPGRIFLVVKISSSLET